MKKRLVVALILLLYTAILIKVMVFKDVPTIRIGQLMLNFGGTDTGHSPNFVPFKTILPYLFGFKGWIIAGINLLGNIVLLVPIGFLTPLIFPNMTWKKTLVLALASGIIIELMQVVLHVGIFDIDDVILNALGVIIGYSKFILLAKWMREEKYKTIIFTMFLVIALAAGVLYSIYPHDQPVMNSRIRDGVKSNQVDYNESEIPASGDLCGSTGGNGQIVSVEKNTIILKQKDDKNLIITLKDKATIRTSAGPASPSDLKIGDRITLVGDVNPNSSFTADAIFVCNR